MIFNSDFEFGDACELECGEESEALGYPLPIYLLGDYLTDQWITVRADGMSKEAIIPRYRQLAFLEMPGGAGNVRANIRALGEFVIGPKPPLQTPTKTRYITEEGLQVLRCDTRDYNTPLRYGDLPSIPPRTKVIVMSDYGKGAITQEIIDYVGSVTRPMEEVIVLIDTKRSPSNFSNIRTRVFVPNNLEYYTYESEYNQESWVIRKEGKGGVSVLCDGHVVNHVPSIVQGKPKSVCGAGDVVLASIAVDMNLRVPADLILPNAMERVGVAISKSKGGTCVATGSS